MTLTSFDVDNVDNVMTMYYHTQLIFSLLNVEIT